MKGRKPIPTHLRVVRGNPGKRPLPKDEPQPAPAPADGKPDWLTDKAAVHWEKVAAELNAAGMLVNVDQHALAMYCETFATWREASDMLRRYGSIVKSPLGFPTGSPYLSIANRAFDQMLKLLVEFGMTPSSRTRVRAAPKQDEDDPYAEFSA